MVHIRAKNLTSCFICDFEIHRGLLAPVSSLWGPEADPHVSWSVGGCTWWRWGAHRTKLAHLENSAFKIRELIDGAAVRLVWCPTDENAADIFTKSLGTRKFKKFQAFLLGLPQDGEFKALICRMLFM